MTVSISKGETLFSRGDLKGAEREFLAVLGEDSNNREALNNLGVVAFQQGRSGEAATYLTKALEQDPFYLEAIFNLYELLEATGSPGSCLALLEAAAKKYPGNQELSTLLQKARVAVRSADVEGCDGAGKTGDSRPDHIPEKPVTATSDADDKEQQVDERVGKLIADAQKALESENRDKSREYLLEAVRHRPFDRSVRETVRLYLKDTSLIDLCGNIDDTWLHLITAAGDSELTKEDIRLLQDSAASFSREQAEVLLEALIAEKTPDIAEGVMLLLGKLPKITADLASRLSEWMDRAEVTRACRDRIETEICLKCGDDDAVVKYARRIKAHRPPSYVVPGFETYPRRVPGEISPDDPYLKHVPESAPSKKQGMRILVISDFNIAGQHTRLMRSLNKYTNHMARCVIFQDDYLSYDRDVLVRDQQGRVSDRDMEEAAALIKKADFFHIGRQLSPIEGIRWQRYISPRNALFQYHGSHLRNNGPAIAEFHAKQGFEAVTCVDWSIYKKLQSSFYHLHPCILERDEIPQVARDFRGRLRICHAPASKNYRRNKRSDVIIDAMNRLAAESEDIESVIIENVPNRKCLELKSRCHIHLASLLMVFGLNAIESAAMGLVPVTTLDNFTRFIYHDTPVVHATTASVYEVTKKLIADRCRLEELGERCREWAWSKFDARLVARQYAYLYDLIYHGLSVDYPEVFS